MELTPRVLELSKLFTGRDKISKVAPDGWTYPSAIEKYTEDFAAFEFDETDVSVLTFPKSGTTWAQEIIWNMRNNSNLDNPAAATALNIRSPSLDTDAIIDHVPFKNHSFSAIFRKHFPDFDQSHGMFIHVVKMTPKPRVIKTHLPFPLLSPTVLEKGKVVYVIRDPRDVCISYHHHCRLMRYDNFEGTFDQFIDAFMEGAVIYGPYWPHIRAAWKLRNHPNMHITYYEKMKKDPKAEITKLNEFMGTKLTEQQIEKIVHYTSFQEMKKRDDHLVGAKDAPDFMNIAMVQNDAGFFRKGVSGGWKTALNQEQKDKFDAWIKDNCPDQEIMRNILNP